MGVPQKIFWLGGLSAVRHMALFAIMSVPIIAYGLQRLSLESSKDRIRRRRAGVFLNILTGVSFLIFWLDVVPAIRAWWRFSEQRYYPVAATAYLKNIKIDKELFAPYMWGGYLDWKLPEKKVFIDGRMPSFIWNAPRGESNNAFSEHIQIAQGERTEELFNKYNIAYVLWQNKEKQELIVALKRLDWQEIYSDPTAVIFSK